ncbi:MAG: hypothetical protein WCI18_00085 [Pseudomonadota bacterium]
MLTAERFHSIVFERDKVDISLPLFAATSYFISPSEPSLERFLKAMQTLAGETGDEIDREFKTYFDLTNTNIAELFWLSISDSPSDAHSKSAILLVIKLAEKSKNNPLKYLAAHCLYENSLFKECSALLARIPGADINVLLLEGMCYFQMKQYFDSLSCFENILKLDPKDTMSQKFRCLSLMKLGRGSEALEGLSGLWVELKSFEFFALWVDSVLKFSEFKDSIWAGFDKLKEMIPREALFVDADSLSIVIEAAFLTAEPFKSKLFHNISELISDPNLIGSLAHFLARESANGMTENSQFVSTLLEKLLSTPKDS